jgi:uncharacterized protein (DUF433 family)
MAEQSLPITLDLTKYIEIRLFGERPHLRERRVPVATVVYNYRTHGWSVAETAHNFGLTEAEVLAALLYYEEHRERIDELERQEQAELDRLYKLYGEKE